MTRLTLAFAALLCCLPTATASLSSHTDFDSFDKHSLQAAFQTRLPDLNRNTSVAPAKKVDQPRSFEVTDDTDVRLDGQSCKLQDIPGTATIESVELERDGKTVTKIHFKSKQ